jgi:hypothetical protein
VNRLAALCAAGAIAGGVLVVAQTLPEPRKAFGSSVTPAFEGWFHNPDGTRSFLIGYYNRNSQQELDIPIGPDNRIEPGGPDMGQPTHFMPGRQWGMFSLPVPRDFKATDSYVWTLVANGQTMTIPLRTLADYVMSPFTEIAVGNTPPAIRFEPNGKTLQGPVASFATAPARAATIGAPLELLLWVTDDMKYTSGTNAPMTRQRPPVTLRWSKYRGPGSVTFDKPRPNVEKLDGGEGAFNGRATTNVKFSEPGEYVLHVTANDYSGDGGGGFGCCWTTALVKVTVE